MHKSGNKKNASLSVTRSMAFVQRHGFLLTATHLIVAGAVMFCVAVPLKAEEATSLNGRWRRDEKMSGDGSLQTIDTVAKDGYLLVIDVKPDGHCGGLYAKLESDPQRTTATNGKSVFKGAVVGAKGQGRMAYADFQKEWVSLRVAGSSNVFSRSVELVDRRYQRSGPAKCTGSAAANGLSIHQTR